MKVIPLDIRMKEIVRKKDLPSFWVPLAFEALRAIENQGIDAEVTLFENNNSKVLAKNVIDILGIWSMLDKC